MKTSKAIVTASFMVAVFWGCAAEAIIALTGKTATGWGWLPFIVMVVAFLISCAGLSWVTSETR